jgi:DNA mismatch repair ATPase MutS
MAGKSTFLRTVGTNLILAMSGLPVCAKNFFFKPMKIYSSMRTTDSLGKNESYFHAELKRLSTLIDELKTGNSFFVILDELLKGTNSQDKLNGSREFIKNILNYNSTGLIATHDQPLTDMENTHSNNIKNKCFEVEISGQNILFDYKLKDGVTRNMNASILMKQMNIIE